MLNLLERLELDNKKIILIALVGLAVLYVDFSFVIKSQLNDIKNISPKAAKLKKDIDNLSKDLANMQDLKTKQPKPKEGSALKIKRLVSEEGLVSLLEKLSKIGNKNNIKIMRIRPTRELKAKETTFTPLLINLDLVCSYHNFGSFVNEIENAEELMSVEAIKIESDPTNYLKQRVNFMLRAYVKK